MDNGKYTCEQCGNLTSDVVGIGRDFEYATLGGPFRYARCLSCQHMFLGNRPDGSLLDQLYPDTYYTVNSQSPLFLKGFVYNKKIKMDVDRIMARLEDRNIKSILDVGCGNCARLIALKNRLNNHDLELTGIDLQLSPAARNLAQRENIKLCPGNIEADAALAQIESRFDVIVMSQLLEHLFEPGPTLRRLFNVMNPKGLIIIETPNWQCLDFRLFKKRYWGGYHLPRHFNVFSSESLAHLLKKCGFEVIEQGFLPSPGFWIISLRNWLGLNSRNYSQSIFEFLNFSNLFVVGAFSLLDRLIITCGGKTSNQFLVAQKPA